jgi:hypothetical protein
MAGRTFEDMSPVERGLDRLFQAGLLRGGRIPWEEANDSIADWYSSTTKWPELLTPHGWQLVRGDGDGDGSLWRHPEATNATSASIRHHCLFVYSTNTPFTPTEPGEVHGYTPFRAWAALQHGDDLKAAGSAARKLKGFGVNHKVTSDGPGKGAGTSTTGRSADGDEDEAPDRTRRVVATPLSTYRPQRVRWLWEGRLAIGSLGLLAGPEGLGKSTVATDIGGKVSRGTLPGEFHGAPKSVFVVATEDSYTQTILPRFMAAGADLDRVWRIEVHIDDVGGQLHLPVDNAAVEELADQCDAGLMILDPLLSRLGKADTHKDAEVREALEPLVEVAERTEMAVLGLIHFNKSGSTNALDLVMASKAFTAVARSVHTVIRDPDDETGARRFLGSPKNNMGRSDLASLAFTIESFVYEAVDGHGSTGRIVWGAEHQESIDDLLVRAEAKRQGKRETKQAKAQRWLLDHFREHGRRVMANDVFAAAPDDIGPDAVKRASKTLGVDKQPDGFGGSWSWTLPEDAWRAQNPPSPPHAPSAPSYAPEGANTKERAQKQSPGRNAPSDAPSDP